MLWLEDRALLSGILVVGSGPGAPPEVKVYDAGTGAELFHFLAYDARFRGGVSVAVGDVNGNGAEEIVTAPGRGIRPKVKVWSASDGALNGQFFATNARYHGGLSVAVGDVEESGNDDIVTAHESGMSRVSVFHGAMGGLLRSFLAYAPSYHGGVNVAVGDLNRDGHDDIVTAARAGLTKIKVFSGASGSVLSQFRPYGRAAKGGISVAVGDIGGDHTLDIITAQAAQAGTAAAVKIFNGRTGTVVANFRVAGHQFARGVRVAAIDSSGDHSDNLALLAVETSKVMVLDTSLLGLAAADPFSYSEGGKPPGLTGVENAAPPLAYVVRAGLSKGAFVAATSSVAESTPAALSASASSLPLSLSIPPIQRLAYYDSTSCQFVPVVADDPRLVGKDVVVLVHGWAPGYIQWVQAAAAQGEVLEWWQTFPGQIGYDASISGGLAPASEWLLDGHTESSIVVSTKGLVQDILASDPSAAVLAYSWIDDSATPVGSDTGIPEDAYLAQAKTALNGERLAFALEQVLGSEAQFHGKLQLIGHSYGSKVATVAAVALTNAATPFTVNQLTILDSPEAPDTNLGYLVAADGAANDNWFFLQDLSINRSDPGATFVDNYISYFDEPYDVISYPGSNSNLSQVVDVSLDGEPYDSTDVGGQHSYAAFWYAGSAEPSLTYGNVVGRMWSSLLAGNSGPSNPPQDLSPANEQSWNLFDYSQSNQFDLQTYTPSAASPIFNPVSLPAVSTAGVDVADPANGASVALSQTNGTLQSYTGSFTTAATTDGVRGLTFTYQFQNPAPGDELTISVDGNLAFVMDASVVQSQSGPGTISLGDLDPQVSHSVTFTLTSTLPNSSSSVVVSNFRQFADE